ncbi:26S proteasome regulatory subunit N6 [Pleurostoma richardsiae]|uniref:26S proteasome regulatory subunit N6 n=1 Tax=Pleurostoma richardsiae TaxID=41990 RepID=A0AA38R8G0_9PEZI|nr:26S proteasome regulatory subunit N6 [Pleurostoma richardsiae]
MQQQYRPYPQNVPPRSAHPPAQRRGGIGPMMSSGPHHSVPPTQAQLLQQQQQQQAAVELAKRRSRKPTDKSMPDGMEDCVIGDGVARYKELRDFERRLDATMTRKRLDIVDSVNRNAKRYKTLRIWISNTVEDQTWQGNSLNVDSFDFSSNLESSYRVKIEGRLLEDDDDLDKDEDEADVGDETAGEDKMDTDAPAAKHKPGIAAGQQRYRFSHFFKALTVEFDKGRMRNGAEQSVEWKKPDRTPNSSNPAAAADFDELTFKRSGDENVNITINLTRHEDPERYELSPEMADVVDLKEATRTEVVMGLWEYIKLMGLQEDEEKRNFRCDDLLRKVIGRDSGYIPALHEYVNAHLRPLPPVKLAYTIRVDEEFHKDPKPTIYDVRVAVDDPLRAKLFPFIHNPQYATMLKEVASLDEHLALLIQAISAAKAKHSFFMGYYKDPANFVRNWLSSQKRDLEIIMGEAPRGGGEDATGDEWRKGGRHSVWGTQNARESVNVMLSKQPAQPR